MNHLQEYYNNLLNLSGKIVTIFSIVPIIGGLFYFKYFNKPLKVYFWYLLFGLFLNILAETFIWSVNITTHYEAFWKAVLAYTKIEDTNFFNGISYFAAILFFGWFYYLLMQKAKYTIWLKWLCIVLCIFQIFNYVFIDGFRAKGAIGLVVSNIYCLVLPAIYLWYMSNNPPDVSIRKNAYFLISITLFLLSILSFIYSFTAENIYETNFILYCKIKIFKNGIFILTQIILFYAFTQAKFVKYL